jgi:hypothetical protein
MLLASENLTRLFLKSYKIDMDEYNKDIENIEHDVTEWTKILGERYINGLDIYPYMYILHKVHSKYPSDLDHFLRYFTIIIQKYGVIDIDIPQQPTPSNILTFCKQHDLFIYFAATLQYYFL